MRVRTVQIVLILSIIFTCALRAYGEDTNEQTLILQNHVFMPKELIVPAGAKIKLTVLNNDSSAAEFESKDLGREKIIPPNGKIYIYIGPLEVGTYEFLDDFHRGNSGGKILSK